MKAVIYLTSFIVLTGNVTVAAEDNVPYPTGYRYWTHVKTLTLHKGHPLENPFEGIHHIYTNKKGLKGLQSGQYKKGATFVFDLLENNTANSASAEGKRKLIGVMFKDNNKYAATGGWGFEAWKDNNRLTKDKGTSCFACHASQQQSDYVFSKWRK